MPTTDIPDSGLRPSPPGAMLLVLAVLRVVIGWHFLYEGLIKLADPRWTAASYLAESKWIFAGLFRWMASDPAVLTVVDALNAWGLTLIGLVLVLGLVTRLACISGVALLALYYVTNPPLIAWTRGAWMEGNYLLIDKNMVELTALLVLAVAPKTWTSSWGLSAIVGAWRARRRRSISTCAARDVQPVPADAGLSPGGQVLRSELLKGLFTLPVLGAFVYAHYKRRRWESFEERHLLVTTGGKVDSTTSATAKTFHFASLKELKGTLPCGRVGHLELSRLCLGGNLISGFAHARDLIYVSALVKSYHTERKVFDTLWLAEQCGVNAIVLNPSLAGLMNRYWHREGGRIQFISNCGYQGDIIEGAKLSVDTGAHAGYVHGGLADRLVREGKLDLIAQALEHLRRNKLPAGIGAHELDTVKACVAAGIMPDFWVKTLHDIQYWSAQHPKPHDNIWCTNPQETIEFMKGLEAPWIAFKVLAAGSIHPKNGFPFAFRHGADFICVGMYDFQVVEDVNLTLDILSGQLERARPWRG